MGFNTWFNIMKKLIALLVGLSIHGVSHAEDLQCEKSYSQFNQYVTELNSISKTGNAEQLHQFLEKNEYSRLFKDKHPESTYYTGDWMNDQEYQLAIQFQQSLTKSEQYKNEGLELQNPKANFVLPLGEVCIVPWISKDTIFGKKYESQTDLIFVRNLDNNEWRVFTYLGTEKPEDFTEFFPDFPQDIKLSAAKANGEYAVTVQAYEMGIDIFNYLTNSKVPQVLVDELKENIESTRERLKVNGFE